MIYCSFCLSPINENAQVCPVCGKSRDAEVPPHHLLPGIVLNKRYRVGAVLGEGGFGITYIGRDEVLDIRVAIKEYFPGGYAYRTNTASPEVFVADTLERKQFFEKGKQRFLNEARTMALFKGEAGVVNVYDFFEENNTAYTVTENVEGRTLSSVVAANKRLAPEVTVSLLLPVIESLKKVHAQGLIHCAISPDNIMVTQDKVKLVNFDAARATTAMDNDGLSVILKAGYSPEEQYRSKGKQGPWTDIYALCATMYKCITGITPDEAAQRVIEDTMQLPSKLGIKIDPALEAVIVKGMAVWQKDRFRSVDELLTALKKRRNDPPLPLAQAISAALSGTAAGNESNSL